jgi:2-dehydro-3-deoxyphosphogluconate aldolase/(4S)-4-hydroxy-2-oxoglutarate aldolase
MTDRQAIERIRRAGVVPVVTIDSADAALPLADALIEGGLPIVEITFRTAAAAQSIARICRARPEVLVGAGTVVTPENLREAIDSGAQFGVAPGLNRELVAAARRAGMLFIPGVCTPSEIEQGLAAECPLLKFFPAEASGGVEMLKAMTAPYAHFGLRYMPSGGVKLANIAPYLAVESVDAVGGTWIATKQDLAEKNWRAIRNRSREAVAAVAKARSRSDG